MTCRFEMTFETESAYIQAYADGRDESVKKLYDWLMDESREPAQTKFTAGHMRNLAREIEFRLK